MRGTSGCHGFWRRSQERGLQGFWLKNLEAEVETIGQELNVEDYSMV